VTTSDWIDKDFYAALGVSSSASQDEIKKAYRKLARDLHPDKNPGNAKAEAKFKAVSEANNVLSDTAKRKEYDQVRAMYSGGGAGGFGGGGFTQSTGGFNVSDLFGGGARTSASGGFGDIFGNLFNRGGQPSTATRPHRGEDVESEIRIDFVEAVKGVTVPLRLSSPATCDTCHGNGAKPGTQPRVCGNCNGAGVVSRNQGSFAFSEPCPDCRGNGRIIDHPCPECLGTGVSTKSRSLTVRIPAGVDDGQKIRVAGQGSPGRNNGPSGDLFVKVNVAPHALFARKDKDITLTVPVSFTELALGTTLTIPTIDGQVSMRIAAGTTNGRTLRVKGKGITTRDGRSGDLLVTLQISIPARLTEQAETALRSYLETTVHENPRPEITKWLTEHS
jgi:molecular chaperone DnaJ